MNDHDLFKTGDEKAPDCILDRNGEVVLGLCKICNGGESSLTTDCCGRKLSSEEELLITNNKLDYRKGTWWSSKTDWKIPPSLVFVNQPGKS